MSFRRQAHSLFSSGRVSSLALGLAVALCGATGALGCSSQKEPEEPPRLEQPDEQTAPPSSKKVSAGLDAIRAQNFPEAERLLAEAVAESPEDPQAHFYYGVALEGVEKLDEAEASYRKAISLSDRLVEASQNLSALLLDEGKLEEALAVADAALAQHPEDPGLLGNRALALDAAGDPAAVAAYEKVLKKKPDEPWLRFNYATALAANDRPDDAKKQLAQLPADDPELAAQAAQLYGRIKDFPGCVATLDKALVKNEIAELYVHRGVCKHSAGDDKGAGADLEKAVQIDPTSAAAHYYLGRHWAAAGKKEQAKQHLQKAIELGEGTPLGQKAREALAELSAKKK